MVGRYVRFTAASGAGDEVAALLLDVARSLRDAPGCRLYAINRDVDAPDTVWVTELWDDEASVDASLAQLQTDAGKARLTEIMSRLAGPPQRTDLTPLGGVGPGLD
jgi:quinol monooxygenase YgiN